MSGSTEGCCQAIVSQYGEGRPVHVLGADLKIKISSRDTNGAFAVFEARAGWCAVRAMGFKTKM